MADLLFVLKALGAVTLIASLLWIAGMGVLGYLLGGIVGRVNAKGKEN